MKDKRKELVPLIVYILILVLIIVYLLFRINMSNTKKYLNLDVSACKLVNINESRSLNSINGEFFFQYDCSKSTTIENEITSKWKLLTSDSDIYNQFFNAELCNQNGSCTNFIKNYIDNDLEEPYYTFKNKRTNTEELEEENSDEEWNYSITLYDKKTKMLYYYQYKD